MAKKWTSNGNGEFDAQLGKLEKDAIPTAKMALYQGAKVVADALTAEINALETEASDHFVGSEKRKRKLWPKEKEALQRADRGIALMRSTGDGVDTIVGMAGSGYVTIHGREVPVPVIARSCDTGTSFMVKQPFMRRAIQKSEAESLRAMGDVIDKRFKEITEGKK